MSVTRVCPECGAELAGDTPGGLCPTCLMGAALGRPDALGPSEQETVAYEGAPRRPVGTTGKTTVDVSTFERTLIELELVALAELQRLAQEGHRDAADLARALVRAGSLTPYQAGAVLQGKARGLVIGNYFILGKLGAGGMGVVFKARHRRLGRIVALKILPPSFGRDRDMVLRFRREVDVAARLSHPNIVSVLDADDDRGVQFLTMECIDGQDLDHLVRDGGALPVAQALDCVIQAARGLESAHAQGIVHRDIKPSNLMLDGAGVVRVLDLGLARFVEGASPFGAAEGPALTQSGAYMGTVDFMAPEQANDSKRADHRADIYSLGCSLYYLLTGRPPFEDETVLQRIMAHQERPAPSLRAVRPEVSKALDAAYHKLVAKRPSDRPRSMTEVIVLLDACRSSPDEAEEARSGLGNFAQTVMKRASPRRRKDRDASVFARPTEVGAVEFDPDLDIEDLVTDYRRTERVAPAAPAPVPKRPQPTRARRKARPKGVFALGAVGALTIGVLGLALVNRPETTTRTPRKAGTTRPDDRPTNPADTKTKTRSLGSYGKTDLFTGHDDRTKVRAIAVMRGGLRAVSCGEDDSARLWNIADGAQITKYKHGRIVLDVAASPDGKRVVTGTHGGASSKKGGHSNGAFRIWDATNASQLHTEFPHDGSVNAVAISPDGRRALSAGSDGTLYLWDLVNLAKVRLVGRQEGAIHYHGVAFFPDSRRAATVGEDRFVHIWNVEEGKEIARLTGQEKAKGCVAISPDGQRVATGSDKDTYAFIWDVAGDKPPRSLSTPKHGVELRVVFQSNDQLAGTSNDTGEVVLWDADTGELLRKSATRAIKPSSIAALPNGRLLTADGDGVVRLWTPRDP